MFKKEQIDKVIKSLDGIEIAVIDLFSGFGGTSTGIEQAIKKEKKLAKVILCINHDEGAIINHTLNHPDVIHLIEDVRKVRVEMFIPLIEAIRKAYPHIQIAIWASLECTNFSNAKGGQPRDADSRTLAWDLLRYIIAIQPDRIYIENVVEFMSWGPLDINGKPESKTQGVDYERWKKMICHLDYKFEHTIINSADLGAFTSRKRFFGQFARPHLEIKWPISTHSKKVSNLKQWEPVKEVLNLTHFGESIFSRKKDLSPKTLERVLIGAETFVSDITSDYLMKYHGCGKNVLPLSGPASCLTTKDRLALIQTQFMDQQYGASKPVSLENPAGAITVNPKLNLVTCSRTHYLINPQWFNTSAISTEVPCPTLIARMDKAPLSLATAEQGTGKVVIRYVNVRKEKTVKITETGNIIYFICNTDSEIRKKLIVFMACKRLVDIKMRMLDIDELLRIQGFPNSYQTVGTKTNKKKYIGNSVVPVVAEKIIEANFI